jgi:hypothetical protein
MNNEVIDIHPVDTLLILAPKTPSPRIDLVSTTH